MRYRAAICKGEDPPEPPKEVLRVQMDRYDEILEAESIESYLEELAQVLPEFN